MSHIKITGSSGWGECDDCGSYDWEDFKVTVDGKEVLHHEGDGHMGGGIWYDWRYAVTDILTAMGHFVEIDTRDE